MDTEKYKVIITPTAYKEINKIYDYITEDLYAGKAAKMLMNIIEEQVQNLKFAPKIHTIIDKMDELSRTYCNLYLLYLI